jgi:HEAT repeat protein
VAPPPPTVEAALQRFYRYLEENRQAGGPGYGGRQLLDDLRSMGPAGSEALLCVLANGTSSDERSAAAALLGSLQEKRALPMLQHIVEHDSDLMLRRAAARGLRRLGAPEAIPVLETLMSKPHEDRFVRLSAAYGLAELGAPHGVTGLAQIFDESNADGRGRDVAFRALASLDDERSLAFMRRLVTSPSEPSYRLRAIRFVATHGDQEALGALRRVMESSTEQAAIREAAAHAHAALTGAR